MYLDYWGLQKHAFNNTPDPNMYFSMHTSVENAVAELIFAIEEADECLAAVIGEVGLGKTTALRVTLDSINQDNYRIAFVTNPDLTFPQIMREIIGQLTNSTCTIKDKESLLEEFNKILFETTDQGKRVLIFIDEGNAIRRVNLQSLRLLTNMQEDDRNLFTMIIAGQPELGKNLEHPDMANLFQRIGIYCKLTKMESKEIIKDYIEHRLECAGCKKQIFTDEAIKQIWKHSEHGIPRLVNRLCKLALKAGETNSLRQIDASVIIRIGGRFSRSNAGQNESYPQPEATPAPSPPDTQNEKMIEPEIAPPEKKITVVDEIPSGVLAKGKDIQATKSYEQNEKSNENKQKGNMTSLRNMLERMKDRHRGVNGTNLFFQ